MRFILRREALKGPLNAAADERPRMQSANPLLKAILRDQSNVEDVMRLRRLALRRRD